MPGPGPDPATITIDGVVVHIDSTMREGDGSAEHNRTPSYRCDVDGRTIGVVWRFDRGEPHHTAWGTQSGTNAETIWFCRTPDLGPYPGIVEAVTALLDLS